MTLATDRRHHALLSVGGREGLPFQSLHGEPLYAHALRALAEVAGRVMIAVDGADAARVREDVDRWGVEATVLIEDAWWTRVIDAPGAGLLAHDPLCPLVTADFMRTMVEQSRQQPATSLVAVRPVTDTLKAVVGGQLSGTVDRDTLVVVTSPVLIPPELLRGDTGGRPPVDRFATLVSWLRRCGEVRLVPAPSLGRRVEQPGAVHLLECADQVAHQARLGSAGDPAVDVVRP